VLEEKTIPPLSGDDLTLTLHEVSRGVTGMAEVALEQVSKHYTPGVAALADLTLTATDGELVVLVGPSGCGKTTTLRLIAGLETLTSGTIRIDGQVVNTLPPRRRDVALVFQRPTLYPHLTVADNLAFGARLRNGTGPLGRLRHLFTGTRVADDLTARVRDTAELLSLTDVLSRWPAQLSGGQQQRVALGRALVRRPAAFLLDEPLSNLDPGLRHDMRRELHLLQRRLRATMLYVTHDQVEAMTLGDRIVVLDRGKVQQVGPPLDLYRKPDNRFVAGFLGWPPMNFFDGRIVRRDGGGLGLRADDIELSLPPETIGPLAVYNDSVVTVGLRPEHVLVEGETTKDRVPMDVLLIEPLGTSSLVTLGRNGRQLLAMVDGRPTLRERQIVTVRLDMRHIHLFDRSSGTALLRGAPAG
jgi:multiple sugar transport system ATP-binding protein